MERRHVVFAVMAAALAVMISTGIRSSFGLLQIPLTSGLDIGREAFSLSLATQNLIYGLPLIGFLSDKVGSRRVMVTGGFIYAAGLFVTAQLTTSGGILFMLGVVIGLALSATTYVVVLGAVAQLVPKHQQSSTFGVITAAGSSGSFIIPPLAAIFIDNFGWETSLVFLAGLALLIMVLAFGLPASPTLQKTAETQRTMSELEAEEPFIRVLSRAGRHSGFWLLFAGFFVCGFHVAFVQVHLPAYLSDNGLNIRMGALALSVIGVFNMLGSLSFGWLGDKLRKKHLLSVIYLGRAVVIGMFVFFPITETSALIFSGGMGFLWLATVPLTSGTIAHIFGSRYLSTLYGIVFLGHQIGAFLGVWLGGRLFDTTGSYDVVWYVAIALGVVAAIIHTPISDRPVAQPQPT